MAQFLKRDISNASMKDSLREQMRYAFRAYSVQYANAWGGVLMAGAALYGLGWYIKGEDPLEAFRKQQREAGKRDEQ